MDGQLFLVEIVVDKIVLTESPPPGKIRNEKGEILVKVAFGDLFNLELQDEETRTQNNEITFNVGKSCLFPCTRQALNAALHANPLEFSVIHRGNPLGFCAVSWPSDFSNTITPISVHPVEKLRKDGVETGAITLHIKLSCFGKSLQTQFFLNDNKTIRVPKQQSSNNGNPKEKVREGEPLRLKGGGQLTADDLAAGTKSPFVECQVVMEQFDKILTEYKKALGPCGLATCPFSPNVTEDICMKVCKENNQLSSEEMFTNPLNCSFVPKLNLSDTNQDRGETVAACGLPSCPLSRPITQKVEEQFKDKQYKSACGFPACPYSQYKTGLVEEDANMELQFLPPAVSGKCGHAKCPYPIKPELPPIHWDCPDPLPTGPCKNPNCPYLPPDLKAIKVLTPKGLCGSPNCPYAIPNPCASPNCPLKPQPCPFVQDKSKADSNLKEYNSCEEVDCPFAPQETVNKNCANPTCPLKTGSPQPPKKECDNPQCPMRPPVILDQLPIASISICNDPTCPYLQPLPSCGIPNCPYASPPPVPPCGVPNCPYFPECPYPSVGAPPQNNPPQDSSPKTEEQPRRPSTRQKDETDEGAIDYSITHYFSDERIDGYDSIPCSQGSCMASGGKLNCTECQQKDNACPCGGLNDLLQALMDDKAYSEKERDIEKKIRSNVTEPSGDVKGSISGVKASKKGKSETDAHLEKVGKVKSNTEPVKTSRTASANRSANRSTNDKKKRKSKYVYSIGDTYPGVQVGHRECVTPGLNVPRKMGWLWNVYTPCMRLKRRRGWRPGAIGRTIAERIRQHRLSKGIPMNMGPDFGGKKRKRNAYGYTMSDSDESIAPKPTLQIKKKEGCYYITMNPLKDPKTLEDNENPYMDCTPMQFKITKNKERNKRNDEEADEYKTCYCDDDIHSSSSDSELDIEFTPPAGIIRPDRLKKKINVVHCDTQYDVNDCFKEKVKDKDKGKKEKGKGGGKGKGKGGGKGKKGKKK